MERMIWWVGRGTAAMTLAMIVACAHLPRTTLPTSLVVSRRTARAELPARPGQLSFAETGQIAARTTALRVEPAALVVRLGESFALWEHVRVIAVDESGRDLGEVRMFDWDYAGVTTLRLLSDGDLEARRGGRARITLRFPAQAWGGRTTPRPAVVLPILVTDTATTSPRLVPRVPPDGQSRDPA